MLIIDGKLKPIDRLAFSMDSSLLACAGGNGKPLDLWSLSPVPTNRFRLPVRLTEPDWNFCFVPQSRLLLVADDSNVIAFDSETGEEVWRVEPQENFVLAGITVSSDGEEFAIGFQYQYLTEVGYQWWGLNGRKLPKLKKVAKGSAEYMCRGVVYLPPGNVLVAAEDAPGNKPAQLHVIEASGGTAHVLQTGMQVVQQSVVSVDGRHLASQFTRSILVWDTTDLDRRPVKLISETRLAFTGIAFHPSGRYLAATSNDQTVKLYDTESWELAKTFTWDIGRMRSIAFSPDGMLAAAGSDSGKVVVWDVDL